jgi:hypothetical protein
MVRLYNRSEGALVHGKSRLNGGSFANVPKSVADIWIAQYPDRVMLSGDAEASGEADRRSLAAKAAELEAANRRIVDLEEELKRVNARNAPATTQIPATKLTPSSFRTVPPPARLPHGTGSKI